MRLTGPPVNISSESSLVSLCGRGELDLIIMSNLNLILGKVNVGV